MCIIIWNEYCHAIMSLKYDEHDEQVINPTHNALELHSTNWGSSNLSAAPSKAPAMTTTLVVPSPASISWLQVHWWPPLQAHCWASTTLVAWNFEVLPNHPPTIWLLPLVINSSWPSITTIEQTSAFTTLSIFFMSLFTTLIGVFHWRSAMINLCRTASGHDNVVHWRFL